MNARAFMRKHWLRVLFYGALAGCFVDAFLIEPRWIRIDRLAFGDSPSIRVVHISDIHYKGERAYLLRIVDEVNRIKPHIVCFTGDIVEDTRYLDEALDILGKITVPLYGVPGNHEYWSGASFGRIAAAFRATGGDWLTDRSMVAVQENLVIEGRSGAGLSTRRAASEFAMPGQGAVLDHVPATMPADSGPGGISEVSSASGARRILLTHYPADVENVRDSSFDLILAGHSHGGQVRLPFMGAVVVPFGVESYEMGTYSTPAGPLHVSAGLGTYFLPVRFFCRPEITVIEI